MQKNCQICKSIFVISPSKFDKRKTCSMKCRNIYFKDNNEWKKNLSIAHKGQKPWNKGKKLSKNPVHSKAMKKAWADGKFKNKPMKQTVKTKKKISATQQGINFKIWKGYSTPRARRVRNSAKYKNWRTIVFTRDNFTCQDCNTRGCYIEAHHIKSFKKYPKLRFDFDNGITYCRPCHIKNDNNIGRRQ